VRRRYGVDPKQVPDFIALREDPPTTPGAAGSRVGAATLLRRYGTLRRRSRPDVFRLTPNSPALSFNRHGES